MTFSASFLAWAKSEADAPHRRAYQKAVNRDTLAKAGARIDEKLARITGHESDATLRAMARDRAEIMFNIVRDMPGIVTAEFVNVQVQALQARPFELPADPEAIDLDGMVKRACCPIWWRRQLRRCAVRTRETAAMQAGEVCARRKEPYVTNDTVRRYELADKRNADMMARTELESADGELVTLLQAAGASTANRSIRRGELMTRIRGAEEWADAAGMVGLFTTNTAPSRFHPQTMKGGRNPKWRGVVTHSDAQQWLCRTWARVRSLWKREGVDVMGYRVAEPHHDGCPHWHMLLWCKPHQAEFLRASLRAVWLGRPRWFCANGFENRNRGAAIFTDVMNGEPGPHRFEAGAHKYRTRIETLKPGGAVAYVSKYISKGIDDTGSISTQGHTDDRDGEQADMFDGTANRVQRWASAWGIRQFQAIGQPPVTVWRELRRVDSCAVQGASPSLKAAHAAVNRVGDRRACWRAYMDAQGGAMQGRANRLKLATEEQQREGLYGTTTDERPIGVLDVHRPGEVVLSSRKAWKPRGLWTKDAREMATHGAAGVLLGMVGIARPQAAQPWTRVNNCTQRPRPQQLMSAGIVGATLEKGPGGLLESEPWTPKPPPPSPNAPPDWLKLRQMLRPSAASAST